MIDDGDRIYIAIDLKSFYASVECVARKRDPLTTNLVVADESRTEKTICLAVSPSLKSYGISGRARLFEAIQRVNEVNRQRKYALRGKPFSGKSDDDTKVKEDPTLELDFIKAPPRMAEYMKVSGQIYSVYLRDVAPEDIFAYSVDEVFIDATYYLKTYKLTAHDFAMRLIKNVLKETGIDSFVRDFLKCTVIYESIVEDDKDRIGFTGDGKRPLRVLKNGKPKEIVYPRNTIVLDKYLLNPGEENHRRFVLGHEAGHIIANRINPDSPACFHHFIDREKAEYTISDLKDRYNIGEWQGRAELYKTILKDYPDVLTAEEMCQALGINIRTGYKLLKDNKIESLFIGNKYRIPKIHILAYLKVGLLPA